MAHNNPNRNIWWGPPKSFNDRGGERKISWLELFYDLVYIAAIAQVTHHFAAVPTWEQLGWSCLLLGLIYWSWLNGSLYHDLHGSAGIRTRLLTLWQMMCVAAVAITINDAFTGHHKSFAVAFLILELLIYYLWRSTGYYDKDHNKFNIYYRVHYGIAAILFAVSYFTDYNTAFILWIIALFVNITPGHTVEPVIRREIINKGGVFTLSPSILERFGLFTIIVLGEMIFGIVNGISIIPDKDFLVWAGFGLSILLSFLLWWLYFDMLAEQELKQDYKYMQWYLALHMPVVASMGIAGAAINVMLANIEAKVPTQVYWIFCGAISLYIFSIVCLVHIMELDKEGESYALPLKRLLLGLGTIIALMPLAAPMIGPLALFIIIIIMLVIPIVVGMRKWIRYKIFAESKDEETL